MSTPTKMHLAAMTPSSCSSSLPSAAELAAVAAAFAAAAAGDRLMTPSTTSLSESPRVASPSAPSSPPTPDITSRLVLPLLLLLPMVLLLPAAPPAAAGAHDDADRDDEGRLCIPNAVAAAEASCPRADAAAGGSAAGTASKASDRGAEARSAPANAERMALAVCTRHWLPWPGAADLVAILARGDREQRGRERRETRAEDSTLAIPRDRYSRSHDPLDQLLADEAAGAWLGVPNFVSNVDRSRYSPAAVSPYPRVGGPSAGAPDAANYWLGNFTCSSRSLRRSASWPRWGGVRGARISQLRWRWRWWCWRWWYGRYENHKSFVAHPPTPFLLATASGEISS